MERFRDREIVFANGAVGETIEFESANPANFHDILSTTDVCDVCDVCDVWGELPKVTIDAKLFVAPGHDGSPLPCVIVVPGSVGVAQSHLMHTETLCEAGYAACILDPFGPRGVVDTYDNQTQFSFAASAFDVLAALKALAGHPLVDGARIGVQGHSRGGAAVVQAAMRAMRERVLGDGLSMKAVYGVYPWAGQQFLNPDIGDVRLRIVIGEQDEWCSPQQAQGYAQAIRLASSGEVSFKMYRGAHHSYDRRQGLENFPTATVAPHAPIVYIDESGAFIDPVSGLPNPAGTDRDFMIYAAKAGFMVTGAQLGSSGTLADQFREDMLGFWEGAL